jgi:hypothetical protein
MGAAVVLGSLFTGPSRVVVAVVFVLAIAAAATVLWMFRGLLVDRRADGPPSEVAPGGTNAAPTEDAVPIDQ